MKTEEIDRDLRNVFNMENYIEGIDYALKKIKENISVFKESFPSPVSENLYYYPAKNTGWSTSFWTGALWLAYEISKDGIYRIAAEDKIRSFKNRLEEYIGTDSIHLGRLYSLSAVAAYKVTGNISARELALKAANMLIERYISNGEFLLVWGKPQFDADNTHPFVEVSSLIDIPLLYWATQETGDGKYSSIAKKHLQKVIQCNIREDGSTYHQYRVDPISGDPLYGENIFGYNNESCFSRGHALGIYGLVLNYVYTGDVELLKTAKRLTKYFINRLPEDNICYWDLFFKEGAESRDSSAAAIAASGMLELAKYLPVTDKDKYIYERKALEIIDSLMRNYTTNAEEYSDSNGIMRGGVYQKKFGYGEDECVLIGEYFYLEALIKATNCYRLYW